MSIVTKTGDNGTTALMYNRRVSKSHPRVEACGAIDELNATLGFALAFSETEFVRDCLHAIQKDLIALMGEIATVLEDLPRYIKDGYSVVTPDMTARVERAANEIEAQNPLFKGWALPGANASAAALDLARTVCRRAERRVCNLREKGELQNA